MPCDQCYSALSRMSAEMERTRLELLILQRRVDEFAAMADAAKREADERAEAKRVQDMIEAF